MKKHKRRQVRTGEVCLNRSQELFASRIGLLFKQGTQYLELLKTVTVYRIDE
jgi:hypothetical protein